MSLFCTMPVLLFLKTYKPFLLKLWSFLYNGSFIILLLSVGIQFNSFIATPLAYIIPSIIILNSVIGFFYKRYFQFFVFHPFEVFQGRRLHTIFSSALVHSNWSHLLVNVILLYIFLKDQELLLIDDYGFWSVKIICVCGLLVSLIGTNLIIGYFKQSNIKYSNIGVSAAVWGLAAFSVLYLPLDHGKPKMGYTVYGYYYLIHMFILFGILSLRKNNKTNHLGHLLGVVMGTVFVLLLKPSILIVIINHISHRGL